ncbi:TPA: DNA-binding protein [Pasteurella multocida]|uniref:DNA-binding protein n=1 Tax=Pasteurella multocida TaxID=747 RepID=UPI001E569225|nr:DNA-binding protein [Pasteurella multocida]
MSGNNLKTHYSAKELLSFSLSVLPNSVQGIIYQAKKNNWTCRKRLAKGGGVEYEFSSLPHPVQAEILLKKQSDNKTEDKIQSQMSESAWNVLASATFEQEKRAERRFQAVVKVARLVENKIPLMKAFEQVVALYATDSDDETISMRKRTKPLLQRNNCDSS